MFVTVEQARGRSAYAFVAAYQAWYFKLAVVLGCGGMLLVKENSDCPDKSRERI
jgi:hypothetical protein